MDIQEEEQEAADRRRIKDKRRQRRREKVMKDDRLLRIINQGNDYDPRVGYIDYGFDGQTLSHTGKYIKYPKNSNTQKMIKKKTNKKSRKHDKEEAAGKGNLYRRLVDYWWILY